MNENLDNRDKFNEYLSILEGRGVTMKMLSSQSGIKAMRLRNLKAYQDRNVKDDDIRAIEKAYPDIYSKVTKQDIVDVLQMKIKQLELENQLMKEKLSKFGLKI